MSCYFLGWKMPSDVFVGLANNVNHHTRNLASAAWVIYDPFGQLLIHSGACLGSMTKNIVEYRTIIELLLNVILHGIRHIIVH